MRVKQQKIWYLCDGNVPECKKHICYKRVGDFGCKHTSDINHAINFSVREYPDRVVIREIAQEDRELIVQSKGARKKAREALFLSIVAFSLSITNLIIKRAVHLHDVGFYKKSCLTGTRAADNQNIFISCVLGQLRSAGHHQKFRCCQNDVLFKNRVHVRLHILCSPPPGRTVFFSMPVLLGILPTVIHNHFYKNASCNSGKNVHVVNAKYRHLKNLFQMVQCFQCFFKVRTTRTIPIQPRHLIYGTSNEQVRGICQKPPFLIQTFKPLCRFF